MLVLVDFVFFSSFFATFLSFFSLYLHKSSLVMATMMSYTGRRVLAHVRQCKSSIYFQILCCISAIGCSELRRRDSKGDERLGVSGSDPGDYDACNGDLDSGSVQQLVAQVNTGLERYHIALDGNVVFFMQPVCLWLSAVLIRRLEYDRIYVCQCSQLVGTTCFHLIFVMTFFSLCIRTMLCYVDFIYFCLCLCTQVTC